MSDNDLPKCPFCAGDVHLIDSDDPEVHDVECDGCAYIFYDVSINNGWWRSRPIEDKLKARIEELESNVMAFAGQLQAWDLYEAADEVIKEILGGNVNAPDYYAMKKRVGELESALRKIKDGLCVLGRERIGEKWLYEIAVDALDNKTDAEAPVNPPKSDGSFT